jgi:hypothetical protein
MRNAAALMVVVVALLVSASAQSRPDFSGKWTETGSAAEQAPRVMTVQQDAAAITVGVGAEQWTFKLDGSETKISTRQNDGRVIERVATMKWEANTLVLSIPGRSNGDGEYVIKQVWAIDAGKLVVKSSQVSVSTGKASNEATIAYTK